MNLELINDKEHFLACKAFSITYSTSDQLFEHLEVSHGLNQHLSPYAAGSLSPPNADSHRVHSYPPPLLSSSVWYQKIAEPACCPYTPDISELKTATASLPNDFDHLTTIPHTTIISASIVPIRSPIPTDSHIIFWPTTQIPPTSQLHITIPPPNDTSNLSTLVTQVAISQSDSSCPRLGAPKVAEPEEIEEDQKEGDQTEVDFEDAWAFEQMQRWQNSAEDSAPLHDGRTVEAVMATLMGIGQDTEEGELFDDLSQIEAKEMPSV